MSNPSVSHCKLPNERALQWRMLRNDYSKSPMGPVVQGMLRALENRIKILQMMCMLFPLRYLYHPEELRRKHGWLLYLLLEDLHNKTFCWRRFEEGSVQTS